MKNRSRLRSTFLMKQSEHYSKYFYSLKRYATEENLIRFDKKFEEKDTYRNEITGVVYIGFSRKNNNKQKAKRPHDPLKKKSLVLESDDFINGSILFIASKEW